MENGITPRDYFIKPGYVYVPAEQTHLRTVVASGIGVTLFDRSRKIGGMSHYIRPFREKGSSTAVFAAPALTALARMLMDTGSIRSDLEAHFYGGAVNPQAAGYEPGISEDNIRIGLEILGKLGIAVVGQDVGGERARKIVFHTGTGEIMMAKVEAVRATDWYPEV